MADNRQSKTDQDSHYANQIEVLHKLNKA
jgi:hypothetical protein